MVVVFTDAIGFAFLARMEPGDGTTSGLFGTDTLFWRYFVDILTNF